MRYFNSANEYNNICFGLLECTKESVVAAAQKVHIHDFIMSLPDGYDTIVGDRGMNLSGGQRQCIALARAVLKNSPIIVLDEATAALDSGLEDLVMKELDSYCAGKTLIYITHRIDSALKADYIYVFGEGRVLGCGTPEELALYRGPFKGV
ncbi:MAG: ATP-binding cassette domain-containing protein [Bacteroidales bacterium]|nr:ATP-binding cassette domain-containing protein [Bacteroidales bacterium]